MLKLESTTETTILQDLTQTCMKPLVTLGTTTLFIFTTPKTLSRRTPIFSIVDFLHLFFILSPKSIRHLLLSLLFFSMTDNKG